MALSPDQSAVLELLLAGQTYAELEELLGIEESEVRGRSRAGLEALCGADPDRNVGLSDYLLGQADPIGRADAVRHLRQDAEDHALATEILRGLREMAPGAKLPDLPGAPGGGAFGGRAAAAPAAERRSPLAGIPHERGRLYAALGAVGVILVFVVLAVTGTFSGDDSSSDSGTTTASGTDSNSGIPDGDEVSRVPLLAPGGGDAKGAAIVGVSTDDQPYLDLLIQNLQPAPEGDAYVVWFMFDENTGYPLSPIFPERDGSFNDRFAIPQTVIGLIARTKSIEVSVSNARATLAEIQKAAQSQTFRIKRPGRTVLQGRITAENTAQPQG